MNKRRAMLPVFLLLVTALLSGCGDEGRSQDKGALQEKIQEAGEIAGGGSEVSSRMPDEDSQPEKLTQVRKGLVGVSLPDVEGGDYGRDARALREGMRNAGYAVRLKYAGNRPAEQISQIEDLIREGCSLLIISPVEGVTLGGSLAKAAKAGVPVIGYGGRIGKTKDVTCYVSFDDFEAGRLQASYVMERLGQEAGSRPRRIEIFSGAPGDKKAEEFYRGAMDVLNPYIASGKISVHSGRSGFSQTAVAGWSAELARARMENLLGSYYADGTRLDAVLCADDSLVQGVVGALELIYSGQWPVIAGQGCDAENIKLMREGRQAVSLLLDGRVLAEQACIAAVSLLEGTGIREADQYYEEAGVRIPVVLCVPETVDGENYEDKLLDSGYYEPDQINP